VPFGRCKLRQVMLWKIVTLSLSILGIIGGNDLHVQLYATGATFFPVNTRYLKRFQSVCNFCTPNRIGTNRSQIVTS